MDHDLFQIRRREREAGGQRGVLFAEKRFELSFVAARADARGPQRGRARLVALRVDGDAVAMYVCVLDPECTSGWALKTAYDEAFAAYGPGMLMFSEESVALHDTRLRRVDSCAVPGHPLVEKVWGDRVAIAAYLGSSDTFDRAMAAFSESYADQNERDYRALLAAIADGRVTRSHLETPAAGQGAAKG